MSEESLNGTINLTEYATEVSALDPRSKFAIALQAASMVVIMVVALGGNLLILAAIYIDKTLQTITNVFIVNLACADMLLAIIGMPFTLTSSITYDWIFGDTWCKVNGMANSLFCIASILTLAAVSVDRYFAILYPFKYMAWITKKVAVGMIFYVWSHAFLMACLPLTSWSKYTFIRSESICTVQWEYSITYTLFLFSVCFFVPLGVMMYTYLRIFRTAKKQSKKIVPVTGKIEGKDEPSTSEFISCYDSRTNLENAGLPARTSLSTKEMIGNSSVSINSNNYNDRPFSDRQAFAFHGEQRELGQDHKNLYADDHQVSKDSGLEEVNFNGSNLLRPDESSAITARNRTSSIGESVDGVSVLNSSCGSFQDSVFEDNGSPKSTNKGSVQIESTQNDISYVNAPFPNTNKVHAYRKTGGVCLPPLPTATRNKEANINTPRFYVPLPPVKSETINNNISSTNDTVCHIDNDSECIDGNSPTADNQENSQNMVNQSNTLLVSKNQFPHGEGVKDDNVSDTRNLNIVVSRCSSYSSFSPSTKETLQPNRPRSQTDRTGSARKKKFSTASVASLMNFSGPNSFRAFSKSSLALMKLRKKKDVQARAKMRRETKAAKTLLIVVGTFVLCWAPHFIGIFCFLAKQCSWPNEFFAITTWFAMLNSACNPVIYGVMSMHFRKRFKQILQCKRGFF